MSCFGARSKCRVYPVQRSIGKRNGHRQVNFITDTNGLVLQRNETDDYTTEGQPRELHFYLNGMAVGDISNNGTSNVDHATSIAEHRATTSPGGQ